MVQSFPIPGFKASWNWANLWHLGNSETTVVALTESGRLRIEKSTDHTVHLILNGQASDLKSLGPGRGCELPKDRNGGLSLALIGATSGTLSAQLVLHEFDAEGRRLSRGTIANGLRSVYVSHETAAAFLVTIRLSGLGSFEISGVEVVDHGGFENVAPGLHPMGSAGVAMEGGSASASISFGALMSLRRALYDGLPLSVVISATEAAELAPILVVGDYLLEAKALVEFFDLYETLSRDQLLKMLTHARQTGYLVHALACAKTLASMGGAAKDKLLAAGLAYEAEFFEDHSKFLPRLSPSQSHDSNGPVIHLVGKSMPYMQNGYTIRTQNTVESQLEVGLVPLVAVQSGGNKRDGVSDNARELSGGVSLVEFAGPARAAIPSQEWLEANASQLYSLVKEVRPRVIHAHSDYVNAILATHIGKLLHIPVVYEVRGLWEESWFARVTRSQGWADTSHLTQTFGVPEFYTWTRTIERRARADADHIVTLSHTVRNLFLTEDAQTSQATKVSVVPNAATMAKKRSDKADPRILEQLGIPVDAVTIGYISTLSAHEDIETLIRAFAALPVDETSTSENEAWLLIAGGGPSLQELQDFVSKREVKNVVFTGQLPYSEVPNYYAAIDIFVTPRSAASVSQLVTPLKPFEALASGCITILSDSPALREVGSYVAEGVEYYAPGDAGSLTELLHKHAKLGSRVLRDRRRLRPPGLPTWTDNAKRYTNIYDGIQIEHP